MRGWHLHFGQEKGSLCHIASPIVNWKRLLIPFLVQSCWCELVVQIHAMFGTNQNLAWIGEYLKELIGGENFYSPTNSTRANEN